MSDIRSMAWGSFTAEPSDAIWNRRIRQLLVVGIALRVLMAFGVVPGMQQMGDGPAYVRQVEQILSGTVDHFYFPPGTAFVTLPVFQLLGVNTTAEHVAGTLLSVGFLLSVTWLASSLRMARFGVFIATGIAAFYPHVVLSTAQISSLPLTAIAVSLAVGCVVRAIHSPSYLLWTSAAFFSGVAVLTRPGTLLLAPFLIILTWLAVFRTPERRASVLPLIALMSLVIGIMTLPVMSFHARQGHGWTLATNSEWNLFLSNNRYTPDYKTGHFGQRALTDIDPAAEQYIRGFFSGETAEGATLHQRTVMLDTARAYMLSNPRRTLWRMSNRLRGFFGCDYTAARELQLVFGFSDALFGAIMLLEGGMFIVILIGWLLYLLVGPHAGSFPRWAHVGLTGVIIAPHIAAFALAKYHLPLVPIMICATAYLVSSIRMDAATWKATFEKRRMALTMLMLAVLLVQAEHAYHLIILR